MASPVVEANNPTVFVNGLINAIELFSATDPDDEIVSYDFWDFRGFASSGYFIFDGVPFDNGASFTIAAADLDKLQYVGGSQVGFEGFRVRARDAVGNFSNGAIGRLYTVKTNTTIPNVAKPDLSVLANEVVSARDFVRGFDPDGYPLTQFEFSDLNDISTLFSVNGRIWVGSYQHRFESGDIVTISGADQAQFNMTAEINVTNDNVFYIDAPGLTPESATGDMQVYSRDNGYFELDGVPIAQGTTFTVSEAELDDLVYRSTGSNAEENIYLRGFDGVKWSHEKKGIAETRVNANRPSVQFSRSTTPADEDHAFTMDLDVTDADMNTMKEYLFYNTSPHAQNGELVYKGETMPRQTWFSVPADELDQLIFRTARQDFEQLIRVRAYDGKHWSGVGTHSIVSTPPIIRPAIEPTTSFIVEEQRETVFITNIMQKTDVGEAHTSVQIFDPDDSPESGHFRFSDIPLDGDRVYEFTTNQFERNVTFYTGDYQSRHFDFIYQRNFNGSDWTPWEKIEIRTEPEINGALESGATWEGLMPINREGQLEVTFSFMQRFPDYETGEAVDEPPDRPFQRFDDTQRANTRLALESMEKFVNVDFVEVPDTSVNVFGGEGGIMRFGEYGIPFPTSVASAFAFLPGFGDAPGDIWINRNNMPDGFATPMNVDTDGYMILLHEIGHAMGLKHPFQNTPQLPFSTDNNDYSVMSYSPAANFVPSTYQLYDVYELQQLYGANMDHNTGDDVYSIGEYFGRNTFVETIWDAGGTDTLSGEGSPVGTIIDLRQGFRSSIGTVPENTTIAYDVDIENAVGSSFDDTLRGNHMDNDLVGGDGDDTLYGMQGIDTMSGGLGDDTFQWGVADHDDVINELGAGGRDKIEILPFTGIDSLAEDVKFTMSGDNLLIDLSIDGGSSEGILTVTNQSFNGFRIESFEVAGQTYDLVNLTSQIAAGVDTFQAAGGSSEFGLLVTPVI